MSVWKVYTSTDRPASLAAASTSIFSDARRSELRAQIAMRSKCFCANALATEMPIPGLELDVSDNITADGFEQYVPAPKENEGWRAHF